MDTRNIDWKDVENKVNIICKKFNNIDQRFKEDLAQELRIHAYYKSDDYYDLQRKAIDFWRSLQKHYMPEIPYFDLEMVGGSIKDNNTSVEFTQLIELIQASLNKPTRRKYEGEIKDLASQIFDIILSDIDESGVRVDIRNWVKHSPYHNRRISCSYLHEVLGDKPGDVNYQRIRKALKMLESILLELDEAGLWKMEGRYKDND